MDRQSVEFLFLTFSVEYLGLYCIVQMDANPKHNTKQYNVQLAGTFNVPTSYQEWVLSTCPLYIKSGCEKERRILFGLW